ncbi:MAG: sugar phosphate isomerase/epimerase family protein [Opitutales bacterium]
MVDVAPIRFACMSLMWGFELPEDRVGLWLDEIKGAGFEGASLFEDLLLRLGPDGLGPLLESRGLSLVSVDYFPDRDRDRLERICSMMRELKALHLVPIGGLTGRKHGLSPGQLGGLLNEIGAVAQTFGLSTGYHHHTGQVGESFEELKAVLAATDPATVAPFLDTGHATKDFLERPEAERAPAGLDLFAGRWSEPAAFIEFKDWTPEHGLETTLGAGRCNLAAVASGLREAGYTGWITLEQNAPMPGRTPHQCARESLETARRLFAER